MYVHVFRTSDYKEKEQEIQSMKSSRRYLKRLSYLIIEFFTPYTCPALAGISWITTLYHKTLNISMKYGAIVIATCTQSQKVL